VATGEEAVVRRKGAEEKIIVKEKIRNRKIYKIDHAYDMSLPLTGPMCHLSLTVGPNCQKSC
jgi:hypothetical protein